MNPLTIFPKHPDAPDTYHIGGAWTPACITAVDKRFTDAELAAEYYKWIAHMNKKQWTEEVLMRQGEPEWPEEVWAEMGERASILYRFATLPHYDENPA